MSEHQNRIQAVLRQIAREWSSESAAERDASFGAAIRRLNEHFASTGANKADVRVLVPGAGLGRLSFDIWQNGYTCEGNEISYYMLLVSNIILNHAKQVCEYSIAPYASTFSNAYSVASQIRTVVFPDVLPVKSDGQFSMGMGEFTEIYAADEPAEWDAVVTCFFIDTSRNILQYIDTIHKILRRGGVWINVGPLLYHFEGRDDGKGSIELTLEELLEVIKQSGFEINRPVTFHDAGYAGDPQSMLKFSYTAAAFTAFRM
ncbi:N2227-like protein [Ramicandelaber brevisporus]|nr:N2227-like protein [Ramicandelaber brevisporus]